MPDVIEFLVAPLRYAFMVRGMIAAVIVGVVCAVMGTYIVLRGMAFLGDAVAHAILPGIAVGYLVSGGFRQTVLWWAMGTGILTAIGIGAVGRRSQVKEDTAIGIIFSGMFALGIAIISTMQSYAVDLMHYLFGNILGVSQSDLVLTAGLGLVFDPVLAVTLRLPRGLLHYLQLVLIAVTIVTALQTVGVALMVAMLTTPAATAYLLVKRVSSMMAVAALIGAVSGIAGLYVSYYVGVASGAAIVLVATSIFLGVLALSRRRAHILGR